MTTKHTPTPWIVETTHDGTLVISQPNRNDGTPFTSYWLAYIITTEPKEIADANARFIAHAANNFAPMLAALEDIAGPDLETLIGMCKEGSDVHDVLSALYKLAKDAIRAAKEGA